MGRLQAGSVSGIATTREWILTVDLLTRGAVAEFGIQWFLTAQLIPDFATMATPFVADLEIPSLVMYAVWWPLLPFVKFPLSRALISILAIGGVC